MDQKVLREISVIMSMLSGYIKLQLNYTREFDEKVVSRFVKCYLSREDDHLVTVKRVEG